MPELLTPDRLGEGLKTSEVYRVYVPKLDSSGHEPQFQFVSAIPDVGEITASDFKNILAGRISKIKNEKAKIFAQLGESFGGYLIADEAGKVMKCDADASLKGQDVLFLSQSTEAHLSVCRSMTEGIAELVREQLSQRDIALQSAEYKAGIFGKQCYQSGQRLEKLKSDQELDRARIKTLRVENEVLGQRIKDEKTGHARRVQHLGRREFCWQIATAVMAVVAVGEGVSLLQSRGTQTDCPQQPTPAAASAPQPECEKPAESAEKFSTPSSFERVLWAGTPKFLEDTKTYRDNILDQFAISGYFFKGKFLYMGDKEDIYQGKKQRIHRFTLIGEKSGYVGRKKEYKKMWQTTTLADVANSILNLPEISQEQLKAWIKWVYKQVFRIELDEYYMRFEWTKDGQLASVFYDAPDGASSAIKDSVMVEVMREMDGLKAIQPGGNLSKMSEPQQVIDSKNHLLLPSGISPNYDILVPASLMKSDPIFTLSLNGFGVWEERRASMMNDRIGRFEELKKSTNRDATAKAFGREIHFDLIAPLVERDDPLIGTLAKFIVKDIPADNHVQRIKALVEFVQNLPYKWENDTDVDRPGFLTLFNGGGDCNNLTILFAQLMMGLGYETAILHTEKKKEDGMIHAMGAAPAKYFPDQQSWKRQDREWVPVELTNKWEIGERKLGEKQKEVIFHIEEL